MFMVSIYAIKEECRDDSVAWKLHQTIDWETQTSKEYRDMYYELVDEAREKAKEPKYQNAIGGSLWAAVQDMEEPTRSLLSFDRFIPYKKGKLLHYGHPHYEINEEYRKKQLDKTAETDN